MYVIVITPFFWYQVWEENYRVTRERQLFEREYLHFVRDILSLVTLPRPIVGTKSL